MKAINGLTLLLATFGCGTVLARDNDLPKEVREAFEKSTEFDLYSLDPKRISAKDKEDAKNLFHGWKILGKTTLQGDDAKKVRAAIEKGRADSDGSVAACFNPRHGVRIVYDKKVYDLVICYECHSATIYKGEERIGSFLTMPAPAPTLNRVLTAAKVTLPKS